MRRLLPLGLVVLGVAAALALTSVIDFETGRALEHEDPPPDCCAEPPPEEPLPEEQEGEFPDGDVCDICEELDGEILVGPDGELIVGPDGAPIPTNPDSTPSPDSFVINVGDSGESFLDIEIIGGLSGSGVPGEESFFDQFVVEVVVDGKPNPFLDPNAVVDFLFPDGGGDRSRLQSSTKTSAWIYSPASGTPRSLQRPCWATARPSPASWTRVRIRATSRR